MYDMDILFIEKVIMAVFQTITIPLCPQFPRAIPRISFNSEIDYKCDTIFLTEIEYVDLSGELQPSSGSSSEPQCPNVPAGEDNWSFWSFQAKWAQLCSWCKLPQWSQEWCWFLPAKETIIFILLICEDLFRNSMCWLSLQGRNMPQIVN